MVETFESFPRRLYVISEHVVVNINKLVRKVALVIDQAVVLGTPVDTGLARSNWLVSVGKERTDVIVPYAPGKKLGLGETANAQKAIEQGNAIIGKRQDGQNIFITNNVHYIGMLNTGSSQQAPSNFVERAILEVTNAMKGVSVLRGA